MVNTGRFVILVLASRLLVPLLSAEPDHAARESYVVYMGSPSGGGSGGGGDLDAVQADHLQMLSSIVQSDEQGRAALTHSYHHAFEGFAAALTEKEAAALSGHERVVSVFKDRALQLHTTRSWDFLEVQSGLRSGRLGRRATGDVIIGVIDTGVWPESPSFNDAGMRDVPARWRGVCMEGPDFKKSNCNKKLIGARYYGVQPESASNASSAAGGSPRDTVGHGTHTASTAAGAVVAGADYYGLARGAAKGGAPASRVAVYRACSLGGCPESAVLKAMDDAVGDGVDVISISIGMASTFQWDFLRDTIALGAFHAHQRGVLVVCSGGNDGPNPSTVVNSAPWILTVAASSIDRSFQSTIALGNGAVVKGVAINFSNQSLSGGQQYPLVFGAQAAAQYAPVAEASNCYPGSLDAHKVAGKIVVCVSTDPTVSRRVKKLVAEGSGARGLVLIDDAEKDVPFVAGGFAFSQVGTDAGAQILEYINAAKNPTAVILPTEAVRDFKPAPVVASFSSRGPGLSESILKPDLMAPGVSILAATIPSAESDEVPPGKKPSAYAIKSGTSMACPHVAGAAAFVKSAHAGWTPSMIRSALMTTAVTTNNLGKPLASSTGAAATGHEMGAGEMSPLRALSPGLVFDTTTQDYLNFLCYYGYKEQLVRKISGAARFSCPAGAPSPDLIASAVNYPSISLPRLQRGKPATVARTAMNVGPSNATYAATVEAPPGLTVRVSPDRLVFSRRWTTARYEVSFDVAAGASVSKGYAHGALTWSDGAHSVRTPFAVNVL
ncbi:hypothetical protein BS78_03G121200 [Paspalum vaginatum]|nr:hypothetical protein BS78_03G121200 [Paspalum vaginatum]